MDISKIAKQQLADYRNINPGTCFNEDDFSLSINEAYAVQQAVVGLRLKEGEKVIGYKLDVLALEQQKFLVCGGPFEALCSKVRFMKAV